MSKVEDVEVQARVGISNGVTMRSVLPTQVEAELAPQSECILSLDE